MAESMMQLSIKDTERLETDIKDIWEMFDDHSPSVLDKEFTVFGRCESVRPNKPDRVFFIELVDGSVIKSLQCVYDTDYSENSKESLSVLAKHCKPGATVQFTGVIVKSPKDGQPIEFKITSYECLGTIEDNASYFLGGQGFIPMDTLRTIPHQKNHSKVHHSRVIITQCCYRSLHEIMAALKIGEVQPTLLTGNECEEGAHPFTVTTMMDKGVTDIPKVKDTNRIDWSQDFFGKHVYLTVSSQLHLEAAVLGSRRDGYCMTTAFRAEPSSGPLHLAEFLMPEWELVGGKCSLERNMAIAQTCLQYIFGQVIKECSYELDFLDDYRRRYVSEIKRHMLTELKGKAKSISKKEYVAEKQKIEADYERKISQPSLKERLIKYSNPFIVTTHAECVRLMLNDELEGKVKFDETPCYDGDFSKQHEFYITEVLYGGMPTFVRYYPKNIKAFYMPIIDSSKVQSADPMSSVQYVDCYDLLFPYVGEVVGGSQRISDAQTLIDRMNELNMDTSKNSELNWYIDLRRDASLPHGGAGLGFSRMISVITGIPNIRDLQEFPRAYALACKA